MICAVVFAGGQSNFSTENKDQVFDLGHGSHNLNYVYFALGRISSKYNRFGSGNINNFRKTYIKLSGCRLKLFLVETIPKPQVNSTCVRTVLSYK